MNLLGQTVKHKKYGKGVITDLTENRVRVRFAKEQKLFQFPEAFPKYLIIKNDSIERKLEKLNEDHRQNQELEQEKMEQEYARRNRLYTMKIQLKSQMAFDLSLEAAEEVIRSGLVDTGCYLSGIRKGKPRIPSALQPNSGILLTMCEAEEKERKIIGAAMVDDSFWGNECEDGKIRLHKEHILMLSPEKYLPFWSAFKQVSIPGTWGSIVFKYFQNNTMQRILQDIRKELAGSEQEETLEKFYRYFCRLNRLS